MDKKILVENVKKVIDSFKNEGKDFSFVGLIPISNSSYVLSVSGTWLESLTIYQSISIITRRLFDLLDSKTLKHINRVEIYDKNNAENEVNELIIEDTIGYQAFYSRPRLQYSIMN